MVVCVLARWMVAFAKRVPILERNKQMYNLLLACDDESRARLYPRSNINKVYRAFPLNTSSVVSSRVVLDSRP